MNRSRLIALFSLVFALNFSARAEDFTFKNLTDADFEKVTQDLSATFTHTSVSGAAPLGDIWGFEIGLVGGQTSTPEVDKLVKRGDANASADKLPGAEILGVVSVPFAITAEVGLVPKIGSDDFKFNAFHLAAKWTPSELFFELPVDLAVKLQYSKVKAEFKDTISGVPTNFDYDDSVLGAWALVSKNFAILEPYAGIGWLKADGTMDVNTSASGVFTGGRTSASADPTTTAFVVGTEVKLLVVKLGVEYMNLFDTSRFTGKLSFYF
jgi:hypothetical protein